MCFQLSDWLFFSDRFADLNVFFVISEIFQLLNVFNEHKSEVGEGAEVIFFLSFYPRKKQETALHVRELGIVEVLLIETN